MFTRTLRNYSSNTPKVHSVALKGFNLQTDNYAQARPSYPKALLEKIVGLVPEKESQVVDLAAGTGLMTKCLVESGLKVTAVEPVENMRAKLKETLPQVRCLEGTSYDMPFEANSVDAIVVAQAFHWFDHIETLREFHRVLKRDGYGILAWNLESAERSDWVAKLRAEYEVYDSQVPQFRKMQWKNVFDTKVAKQLFELPYHHLTFKNDYLIQKSDIWRRVLSKSYISCLAAEEQAQLKQRIESIIKDVPEDDENRVLLPHDSHLVYFKKHA